jgi:hydrogenase maturation protease
MRVLVAGVGNIFFGDDGFGVEVARELAGRSLPDGVRVADFGIRGVHLAFELLDGYDVLVLVDAVPMNEEPGTLAVVEVEPTLSGTGPALDAHSMSPAAVLSLLADLQGSVGRVLVVGCEPAVIGDGIGLSPVVAAAVPAAVDAVEALVAGLGPNIDEPTDMRGA